MVRRSIFYLPEVLTRAEVLALIILAAIALMSLLGMTGKLIQMNGIEQPAFGGTLREGIVGNPRFINPIFAQTDADRDLVSLVYAGLMAYDEEGNLTDRLSESHEISASGLTYTFILKKNLRWSDGQKFTADDVLFTVELAKNPSVQSPRRANWEGVEISKTDDRTVVFELKKAYAPFMDNLTLGILPKHVWGSVPASQISIVDINTNPVGAGPYKINSEKRNSLGSITEISLETNKYFAERKPNIKNFDVKFYEKEKDAVDALQKGMIDSLGAISPEYVGGLTNKKLTVKTVDLQRVIAVFLNKDAKKSLASAGVRKALNLGTDKKALVEKILKNYGETINGPIPFLASSSENANDSYDPDAARELLKKYKGNVEITLTTATAPELVKTAKMLQEMWSKIGIKVDVKTFNLDNLEQSVIGPRRYDAFIYGEEVVGKNPDLFAFWHSSQRAHPGYNIALYANSKTDKLLESVRSEQDPKKSLKLYQDIQKEIEKDMPAIFLFSPHYIYAVPKNLKGLNTNSINTGSERFSMVHKWYLNSNYVWKIFAE
ncbi:ABC transporter substrate-binding protein [Candidatus Giovannonibacteria bacterium]|nr:ABC transporter substrate-binding protein [Candidatus Giovannonibacteria bacterium]